MSSDQSISSGMIAQDFPNISAGSFQGPPAKNLGEILTASETTDQFHRLFQNQAWNIKKKQKICITQTRKWFIMKANPEKQNIIHI